MLSFPMAPMGPYPPRTAVSSVIKWGSYLHCGLTLSYLTDVLWGLMKLCLQCFQFLEKNYLWTFQVLCRYISDLSFLLLYCCVVLTYSIKLQLMSWPPPMAIRALNFPPVHLPDWCRLSCSWDHRRCLPSNWQDGPGHRSHQDPG